jgi:hypothetical protein
MRPRWQARQTSSGCTSDSGKVASFSARPAGDPARETSAMFALGVESREAVDDLVPTTTKSRGTQAPRTSDRPPQVTAGSRSRCFSRVIGPSRTRAPVAS